MWVMSNNEGMRSISHAFILNMTMIGHVRRQERCKRCSGTNRSDKSNRLRWLLVVNSMDFLHCCHHQCPGAHGADWIFDAGRRQWLSLLALSLQGSSEFSCPLWTGDCFYSKCHFLSAGRHTHSYTGQSHNSMGPSLLKVN